MSIQTQTGAPALDASDFQFSHAGITCGIELRHVQTPDGAHVTSLLACERAADGGWVYKRTLAQDFFAGIDAAGGVMQWVRNVLVPAINTWLRERFSGTQSPPPPDPSLPAQLVELDRLLSTLRVEVVNGVPQVSI